MENSILGRKKIKLLWAVLIVLVAIPILAASYSPYYTHPDLTEQMARLFNNKGGVDGLKVTDQQIAWMRQGAIDEDDPPRWINHFYDPVYHRGWTGRNLGNIDSKLVYDATTGMAPAGAKASVHWAVDQQTQGLYRQQGNQTWQKAVQSYLRGDMQESFKALGHVLHLIEDASVPDHTRDDTHVHLLGDPGSPFEEFAERFTNTQRLQYATTLANSPLPEYSSLTAAFVDIAKYSNSHFFSENTINNNDYILPTVPIPNNDEDYVYDAVNKIYLAKIIRDRFGSKMTTADSEKVLPSYKDKLFPKVTITGAAVIKHFFEEVKANINGTYKTDAVWSPSLLSFISAQINIPWWGYGLTAVADAEAGLSQLQSDNEKNNVILNLATAAKNIYHVTVTPIVADGVPLFRIAVGLFNPTAGNLLQPISQRVIAEVSLKQLQNVLQNTPSTNLFVDGSLSNSSLANIFYTQDANKLLLNPLLTQLNQFVVSSPTSVLASNTLLDDSRDSSLWIKTADSLSDVVQTIQQTIAKTLASGDSLVNRSLDMVDAVDAEVSAPPDFIKNVPNQNPVTYYDRQANIRYIMDNMTDNQIYSFVPYEPGAQVLYYRQNGTLYPVYDYDGRYGTPYAIDFSQRDTLVLGPTRFALPQYGLFLGDNRLVYDPKTRAIFWANVNAIPPGTVVYTPTVANRIDSETPRLIDGKLYSEAQAESIYAAMRQGTYVSDSFTPVPPATVLPDKQGSWWDAVTNAWHTAYDYVARAVQWVVEKITPLVVTVVKAVTAAVQGVVGVVKNIASTVMSSVNQAVSTVVSAVSSVVSWVGAQTSAVSSFVSSAYTSIVDTIGRAW